MSRRHRPVGCGSLSLALCLLFLPPSTASAFPNDVLAKLSSLAKSEEKEDHRNPGVKNVSSIADPSLSVLSPGTAAEIATEPLQVPVSRLATETLAGKKPAEETLDWRTAQEGGHTSGDLFPGKLYEDHPDYWSNNKEKFHSVPSSSRELFPGKNKDKGDDLSSKFPVDEQPLSGHPETHRRNRFRVPVDLWDESDDDDKEPAGDEQEGKGSEGGEGGDSAEWREGEGVDLKEMREEKDREDSRENRCPHCQVRKENRQYRIASMKRQILEKLHITSLPNRTAFPVPKALEQMPGIHDSGLMQDAPYGMTDRFHDSYDDDNYTPPERVFTVAKSMPPQLEAHGKHSVFFSIPAVVYRAHIQKAFLWFYVRHVAATRDGVVEMRLLRLGPPVSRRVRSQRKVVWSQKMYPDKAFGWKRIDVLSVVRRWAKHPSSNYGVEIVAMNGKDNLVILPPTSDTERGYEPVLDIKLTDDENRRQKRSDALKCSENSTEHRCCRYPLTVSFAEFGWDWVIAPTHVEADYCSGECRMTLQNQTPYSWISSQAQEGGSCCTPSKMSPLPLLYFDQNGNIVFQLLQNMKVERCGCA